MISRRLVLGVASMIGTFAVSGRKSAARSSVPSRQKRPVQGSPQDRLGTRLLFKGENGYEAWRHGGVWNARKPSRYPAAIVMAESDADVVDAVKLARANGWKVGVRSGGHSWNAMHTRDDAVLINLSRIKTLEVDAAARSAVVSTSYQGQALNKVLREEHGLMFPSGHCYGVGLGGFVMAGGHGWNSRTWGPACANLEALDLVTADGRLIHASSTENSDYLWAARGSGAGFFGVALRYYLKLHPLPASIKRSTYTYQADVAEELVSWAIDLQRRMPSYLELFVTGTQDNAGGQIVRLNGFAFAGSDAEADAALALLDTCPVAHRALEREVAVPAVIPAEHDLPQPTNPPGARYVVDGAWTNASGKQIMPAIRRFFEQQATPESYFMWMSWGSIQNLGDMAYSLQGHSYFSPVGLSFNEADDRRCAAWVADAIETMAPFSHGSQMNDDNMAVNKRPYLSPQAYARLEQLRAKHDPSGLFAGFLTMAAAV